GDLVRLVGGLELTDVLYAGPALDLRDPLFGQCGRLRLFVDGVVVRGQPWNQARVLVVLLRRLLALAGNDQRRARLVDENAVDLVDDREVGAALHTLGEVDR